MSLLKTLSLAAVMLFLIITGHAQFVLNGTAVSLPNDCFRLTQNSVNTAGSFFTQQQIDLSERFDLYASLNFGPIDAVGGDGIAFCFQQFNASVAQVGEGRFGIQGVSPSLIIEFDTDSNSVLNDIPEDHIALMRNGNFNHSSGNNLIGPLPMVPGGANVETGNPIDIHIRWDPDADLFQVWVGCDLRITYNGDIVSDFFSGDPMVFWGFSGSTGQYFNTQVVCLDYFNRTDGLNDTTLCEGIGIPLDAGLGQTYTWAPTNGLSANNIQSPNASPSTTTQYHVTVTDNCGVTRQDSMIFTVLDSVIAELSGDTFACVGEQVTLDVDFLSGSPLYNVSLFDGTNLNNYVLDANGNDTTTNQPPTFTVGNNPVTYTIFNNLTNEFGCAGNGIGSATIHPDILNGIQINTDSISCNSLCDGAATLVIPHDSGSYTYSWPGGLTGPTQNNLCSGTYTVTITNGGNCSETVDVTIVEPAPIGIMPLNNQTICQGQQITLTANPNGGTPPYQYNWSNLSNGNSITVAPTNPTSYSVTVTDDNNCPAVATSATVNLRPPLTGNADPDRGICESQGVSFSAYASGGDGNYFFAWSSGEFGAVQNDTLDTTTTYQVTITDGCGSTPIVDSLTIEVDTFPTHTYTIDQPICEGSPMRLVIDSFNVNATYLFNFGDGRAGLASSQEVFHTYLDSGIYDITLQVRTNYCDSTRTDSGIAIVAPKPRAAFTVSPDTLFTVTSPLATFTSTTDSIIDWTWFIENIRVAEDVESFVFDFQDSGTYDVKLALVNNYGCPDTTIQQVEVGFEFPGFYIPSAFTPNGDGLNDEFGPVVNVRYIQTYEFSIYNRNGNRVFYTEDPDQYWDGSGTTSDGTGQDFFWWKITIVDNTLVARRFEGKVILVR